MCHGYLFHLQYSHPRVSHESTWVDTFKSTLIIQVAHHLWVPLSPLFFSFEDALFALFFFRIRSPCNLGDVVCLLFPPPPPPRVV